MFSAFGDEDLLHMLAIQNARMSFVSNPFSSFDFAFAKPLPAFIIHYCASIDHAQSVNGNVAYPNKVTQYLGNAKGVPAHTGTFVQVYFCYFSTSLVY